MQGELLAQHGFRRANILRAAQLRHQRLNGYDPRFTQRLLKGWKHIGLDDIQQNIVAGNFKTVAETLVRDDMDVSAASAMTIAIEMIIGDDQIGGAAADIDRCDGYSFTLRAVGSAKGVEKRLRVTGKVLVNLGIEINQLRAGRFIPLDPDFRQRYFNVCLTMIFLLILVRIVFAVVPA